MQENAALATLVKPDPVKPFFGLLYKDQAVYDAMRQRFESQFGVIDFISDEIPFDHSDYYGEEMGEGLTRRFLSLETLISPDEIVHHKQLAQLWEEENMTDKKRSVNIDPGYIGPSQLVLSTAKKYAHRLYLGRGVYLDLNLIYQHGAFHDLPWTYPDYSAHKDLFKQIRNIYAKQYLSNQPQPGLL
jgi:hypothetical protein